jgi:hypothetical protein
MGKSVVKILTELLTNSDDSYRRLGKEDSERVPLLVLKSKAQIQRHRPR